MFSPATEYEAEEVRGAGNSGGAHASDVAAHTADLSLSSARRPAKHPR
jgi:hypothetical protein